MHLSIKAALGGMFGLVGLVAAGQGIVSVRGLSEMARSVGEIGRTRLPAVNIVNQINTATRDHRVKLYRLVLTEGSQAELLENRRTVESVGKTIASLGREYDALDKSPEERALYERFSTLWSAYLAEQARVIDLVATGRRSEAVALLLGPELLKLATNASDALKKDVALNKQEAESAVSEAIAKAENEVRIAAVASGVVVLLALMAALFTFLRVSKPIERMTDAMKMLAEGDTSATIPGASRRDEVGAMAAAVLVFRDNLIHSRRLEEETQLARLSAEEQRKAGMREMADSFEAAIGSIATMVSSSATQLQVTAQTMAGTAARTASQSTTVAVSADKAAMNVNYVSAAAEELGVSVQEIGRQVSGSSALAHNAVEEARATAHFVQELEQAVAHIGNVVTLIASIAGQTNLLALNATIEAARAGDAGRGFAVVAAEVKELAGQTARATEDISDQIGRIQSSTGQAVKAIGSIGRRIGEISDVATAIAAAVEEQGAATQEIVRNVSQAAVGTAGVTATISDVASAAEETGLAAAQVLDAASELSRHSERLHGEMSRFVMTVRAA